MRESEFPVFALNDWQILDFYLSPLLDAGILSISREHRFGALEIVVVSRKIQFQDPRKFLEGLYLSGCE